MGRRIASFRGVTLTDGVSTAALDKTAEQPGASPAAVDREGRWPFVSRMVGQVRTLPTLGVVLDNSGQNADATLSGRRVGILQAFDRLKPAAALVSDDGEGNDQRYIMAFAQTIGQREREGLDGFAATLVAQDDPLWRSTDVNANSAALTASGQTLAVTNNGEAVAFPTITLTPTSAKTGGWKYRRLALVRWRSSQEASNVPVCLTGNFGWDTAALVSGGKMNSSNSSVGVIVDGVEVDRWFGGADGAAAGHNDTATNIWTNLDFRPQPTAATPYDSFTAASDLSSLRVNEDITDYPAAGYLFDLGSNELLSYTGKNEFSRTFTGVRRAQHGTTAADYGEEGLHLIQHLVWIVYGPDSGLAKAQDNSTKPLLDMGASDNLAWTWTEFYDSANADRSAAWVPVVEGGGSVYTEAGGGTANPATAVGVRSSSATGGQLSRWYVGLPWVFEGWEADAETPGDYVTNGRIVASTDSGAWLRLADVPSAATTVSDDGLFEEGLRYFGLDNNDDFEVFSEFTEVTLDFVDPDDILAAQTPVATLGDEQTAYALDVTITNSANGEGLRVQVPALALDDSVVLDMYWLTATIASSGDSVYIGVTPDSNRLWWLVLEPGANTLTLTETGLAGLTAECDFEERYYMA